ncbi:G-D-S-L family lipolytic protein [Flavobacterium sp. DG1-102-2]|uniref:G-D-S-L family lipolytic protein n=1 Tax=Flavobacterium sp. DG1-102-2 TaxID=3081663 RepID=UPI002949AB1D|nr:G-D-S-L family lipolytic protein [Flavobacterium sp. DG1-102-2]MDV6168981.1 G-D-S-L family lipolytic protein [Flavobacterium sp. DG1-102-2]
MKNTKIIYLAVLAAVFAGCEPEFDNEVTNGSYSAGEADFSSYVAIGNSLTAGYMDGTVFRSGQQYSYPNILSQQFALVGGGAFTQPSYADDINNTGGFLLGTTQITATRLIINASIGGPQPIAGTPTANVGTLQATAYNNMGVPGAKTFHLLAAGYGNLAGVATGQANPYFVRHATSPTATVLGDAMTKNPTFFTNWIGNNDVLFYAISGGTGVNQTGNLNPATYGGNDITDPQVFASAYSTIMNTLTSNGAKGVCATIPDVTSIPYFTTVPYNPLTASVIGSGNEQVGQATITALNTQLYGPLKQILTAFGQGARLNLLSATEANPLLIKDESLTDLGAQITAAAAGSGNPQLIALAPYLGANYGQVRQATAQDLVLLTTRTVIGTNAPNAIDPLNKYGLTFPLQDQHLLTATEVTEIVGVTETYNNTIKAIAASKNIPVADMHAVLGQLVTGLPSADGQIYKAGYFSSATANTVVFSLDGIHPNARGYAFVANEYIKVINSYYKAHLPLVIPGYFPGATVLTSN